MSMSPAAALIAILVGLMCGGGEGYPHGTGFAVAGSLLGTGIGFTGAWLLLRFERTDIPARWERSLNFCIGSFLWASAVLWLPLLVGVASVNSVAGLVRLMG